MAHIGVMIEAQEGLSWTRWRRIVADTERLGFVPARAEAQYQAAARKLIHPAGDSTQDCRHIERDRAHHRAELNSLCPLRCKRQRGPG